MSYNLYGWNALGQEDWKAANIFAHIDSVSPDLLGTQELDGHADWLISSLSSPYALAGGQEHGVGILYRTDLWTLDDTGTSNLTEMDEWGQRIVRWAHLIHKDTNQGVYFFNTHFCVCSKEMLEGSARTVAQSIHERVHSADPVVLTGDFNVFDGFENSLAVQFFKGGSDSPISLLDSYRVPHPEGAVSTYGAAGKIDYVFVTQDLTVNAATIEDTAVPDGQGSDHDAVTATLSYAP
jgi:endonuclease/exonuclease/phosphatase family metal-dependent hydrolase